MPAKLVLSLNASVLGEYSLEKERITIGRKPDNDIHVDFHRANCWPEPFVRPDRDDVTAMFGVMVVALVITGDLTNNLTWRQWSPALAGFALFEEQARDSSGLSRSPLRCLAPRCGHFNTLSVHTLRTLGVSANVTR